MRVSRVSSKLIGLFSLLVFVLLPVASAKADPIVLSGSALVVNSPPNVRAFVNVTGTNFAANVLTLDGIFGLRFCSNSTAGMSNGCTSANLSWSSTGTGLSGIVTVNGVNYSADVINQLALNFNAPTFTIPPELLSASAFKITAPFTFTGGFASPSLPDVLSLTGQGTVTVFLSRRTVGNSPGLYLDEATYVFGPQVEGVTVEAVPEPATMLLLATGLAGAALRSRKRARNSQT